MTAQVDRLMPRWKSSTGWRISWVKADKCYRDEHHNGNKDDGKKLPEPANANLMWDIRVDNVVTARKPLGDPTGNLLVGTSHSYISCVLKEPASINSTCRINCRSPDRSLSRQNRSNGRADCAEWVNSGARGPAVCLRTSRTQLS